MELTTIFGLTLSTDVQTTGSLEQVWLRSKFGRVRVPVQDLDPTGADGCPDLWDFFAHLYMKDIC